MVDALFPGLHVALMPPSSVCWPGRAPHLLYPCHCTWEGPRPPIWSTGPSGGLSGTPRLMAGALRLPPTCPAPRFLVPKWWRPQELSADLSASVALVTNSSHTPAPVSCCGCPDGHPQMPLSSHREPSWPPLVSSISCPPACLGESRTVSGAMPWQKLALAFLTWAFCHPLNEPREATSWGRAHRGPTDTAPPQSRWPGPSPRAASPHTLSPAGNWVLSRLKTKAGAAFSETS